MLLTKRSNLIHNSCESCEKILEFFIYNVLYLPPSVCNFKVTTWLDPWIYLEAIPVLCFKIQLPLFLGIMLHPELAGCRKVPLHPFFCFLSFQFFELHLIYEPCSGKPFSTNFHKPWERNSVFIFSLKRKIVLKKKKEKGRAKDQLPKIIDGTKKGSPLSTLGRLRRSQNEEVEEKEKNYRGGASLKKLNKWQTKEEDHEKAFSFNTRLNLSGSKEAF